MASLKQNTAMTELFSGYDGYYGYVVVLHVFFVCFFIVFLFNSVLRPFQDYFSSYETGQSVGGAKIEPQEKPPGTPANRTWLVSRGQSGARTHTRHSSEMIE